MIWRSLYAEFSRNYGFLLTLPKDARILEIGPGRGYFADWLICHDFKLITLVDIDEENYAFLKAKYAEFHSIQIVHDEAVHFLKNDDSMYDLIISQQVIEHISASDMHALMRSSRERLRNTGFVVHETINAANIIYGTYYRYIDFSHQNSFTEKSLQEFAATDFEVACKNFVPVSFIALVKSIVAGNNEKHIRELAGKIVLPRLSSTAQSVSYKPSLLRRLLTHTVKRFRWLFGAGISRLFVSDDVVSHYIIAVFKKRTHEKYMRV